jgi:DNA-binding protein HU-beta
MNTLVEGVSSNTNLSDRQVREVIRATVDTIRSELAQEGGKVTITGLGTFKSVKKGDRMARNPRTGEQSYVDPYLKPTFKASELCRDVVNGRR